MGHVCYRNNFTDDAFIAVPAGQFIPDSNFSQLRYFDDHPFTGTGGQFVSGFTVQNVHVNHYPPFAVGHAQGSVADVAGFFTKDSPQQPLFGRKLGLSFGGDFTDQNIVGADFTPDRDKAAFVEVGQIAFADVGNVPGWFLWSKLSVYYVGFVLFNMNRREQILSD